MFAPKKVLGLIGSEISYTLSPLMHNVAAEALGLNYCYNVFEVPTHNDLPAAIEGIRALGVVGANVTIPYKERVVKLLDALSAEASEIQAVNVILNRDGTLIGYNADIYGFAEPLKAFKSEIEKQDVAILGCGGAARAAIQALKTEFNPAGVVIAARNEARADALKADFKRKTKSLKIKTLNVADPETLAKLRDCKLIVNATPVGSARASASKEDLFPPDKVWTKDHIAYDLVYNPLVTPFLAGAAAFGAKTISGLEMLIHQGAKSFEIWTGKQMPIDLVRQTLLNALSSAKND
ncbi:MAG: shikimate dehydrogenase [Chloroherpetonaceae bacterium]|nr:shikimate dehydrogenase [Chloroherpetonaceae bacterium]MDW8437253.1 shikimate dehydrogenase [Chloroherpetonaceae bacterium]